MTQVPKSFLIEDVRDGFMVPANVKQAWAAELEVLLAIDEVCKKHGIQYFADWGTFLGAVRHGGFIPWDDDLDIVMKRKDYKRFLEVASKELPEGYFVQTYENMDPDNWLFMGKVVGRNHICFEPEHLRAFHNFPYIACVDIFVLDYVYRDEEKENDRRKLCLYLIGVADAVINGSIKDQQIEANLQHIYKTWGVKVKYESDPIDMGRALYRMVEKIFDSVPENESDYLVQLFPWGLKGTARYQKKEYYRDAVYLPFEFMNIPVPVAYDAMLRERYGDYLRVVKNAGAHDYPYFDSQKKIFFDNIDIKLPEYTFKESDLCRDQDKSADAKAESIKSISSICLEQIRDYTNQIDKLVAENASDELINEIVANAQQVAIDLGTIIESVAGEDNSIVHILEEYCESMYLHKTKRSMELTFELSVRLDNDILSRRTVVFMPVHKSDMKLLQVIIDAEYKRDDTDVIISPLPYFYKDYDGTLIDGISEFEEEPLSYELLSIIHPECIYIVSAYDNWNENTSVEPVYYSDKLRYVCDELVYVSSYDTDDFTKNDERDYLNLAKYLCMPGAIRADKIVAKNEAHSSVFIEKLVEFVGEKNRKLVEEKVVTADDYLKNLDNGLCVEESLDKNNNSASILKSVFYLTSVGCINEDIVRAEEKIRQVMETLIEYRDKIIVNWYVYPVSEVMRRTDVQDMIDRIRMEYCINGTNVNFIDYEISSNEAIAISDAYYGDGSCYVIPFSRAGKPVMVCNYEL